MKFFDLLSSLGFSPNEAKIYESLLENGELNITQIAVKTGIHRRNVYDAVHRLLDKGLLIQVISQAEDRFSAVTPDKLHELLSDKQFELDRLLPDMKKLFEKRKSKEQFYVFKGYEGQKHFWREMLAMGEDIHILGGKAQWFDPKLDTSRAAFYRQAKKQGLVFNLLLDAEMKTAMPDFVTTYPAKVKARYLPKEFSSNSIAVIFGDYFVTYTGVGIGKMSNDVVFFVIRNSSLAESYRKWFSYLWSVSKE